MTLRLRAAAQSDRGRLRDNDEDAVLVDMASGLFAIADGVGGHRAGEVASRIAVETLAATLKADLKNLGGETAVHGDMLLSEAFRRADEEIRRQAASDPDRRGMASTLVALLAPSANAWVAHVGDSRAYLLRLGELSRLTEDHSALAQLARETPEAELSRLESSPLAHVLVRCLGANGSAAPDIRPTPLEEGDRLLLCCDGLTDMVEESEIERILAEVGPSEDCCSQLVAAANEAGGKDNITVLVADALLLESARPKAVESAATAARAAADDSCGRPCRGSFLLASSGRHWGNG